MATFGITVVARAKHRALFAAAKQVGGVRKFAEHVGISLPTAYAWIAMRTAPPIEPRQFWPQERIDKLEQQLMDLTGQTLEQLFPAELRDRSFLDAPKAREIHQDIDLARLGQYRPDVLALPSPEEVLQTEDVSVAIERALKRLSYREREIVKLRFGLGADKHAYTLEECGHIFKVTRDRIRQIESKALNKLKAMKDVGPIFREAVPDEWKEPPRNLERFDNRPEVSLKKRYAEASK